MSRFRAILATAAALTLLFGAFSFSGHATSLASISECVILPHSNPKRQRRIYWSAFRPLFSSSHRIPLRMWPK
jgi:hypothetical protein